MYYFVMVCKFNIATTRIVLMLRHDIIFVLLKYQYVGIVIIAREMMFWPFFNCDIVRTTNSECKMKLFVCLHTRHIKIRRLTNFNNCDRCF